MLHSRLTRIEAQLQSEVGEILLTELRDPRVQFASVCRVKVSKDLRQALVFVSFLRQEQAAEGLAGLEAARGFIRKKLGERVQLKFLPDLKFILDENIAYAAHIAQILDGIQYSETTDPADDANPPPVDETEPAND